MSFVKFFEDVNVDDLSLVGGKGLSLGRMINAGIPVPSGFVITTKLHEEFKNNGEITEQTIVELNDAFDKLGAERVAVRSSAISEDSETASWAGQFESYLNVGRNDLIARLKDCWDSVKAASDYAQTQGMKQEDLVLGVVVQKMVDSDVSGVAFSVNPISHNSDEIMIEATYGLGELLVQGMVTPDNYVTSKSGGNTINKNIAVKKTRLIYKDSDTVEAPVDASMQEEACLSEKQLVELSLLICRIEDYYGSPQDIEWALQDNEFHIVQSRPITTS